MDLIEKQKLLDAQIEPQSMTFQLGELTPTNSLVVRMDAFNIVAPNFFSTGRKLSDVGCAKGYFSLLAAKNGLLVRGIDYNQKAIDLCRILQGSETKTKFDCVSFRNFPLNDDYYDRIFIGNGPHYMFVDSGGNWDWVDKLAVLSTDLVLLEGGFNFEDPQMKNLVTVRKEDFNWECFAKKAEEFFEIQKKEISPITGRYIVLLKKKSNLGTFNKIQLYDLPIIKGIRFGWKEHSSLFLTNIEDVLSFAKIYPIGCWPQTLQLASLFKKNNPIKSLIYFGEQCIGCCEPYLNPEIWSLAADQKEMIRICCEEQIYLSRQGHIDIDISLGNCLVSKSGEIRIVDKNQIYPIHPLDERHAQLWIKTLTDSNLSLVGINEVKEAILSNDSKRVELAFQNILSQL